MSLSPCCLPFNGLLVGDNCRNFGGLEKLGFFLRKKSGIHSERTVSTFSVAIRVTQKDPTMVMPFCAARKLQRSVVRQGKVIYRLTHERCLTAKKNAKNRPESVQLGAAGRLCISGNRFTSGKANRSANEGGAHSCQNEQRTSGRMGILPE